MKNATRKPASRKKAATKPPHLKFVKYTDAAGQFRWRLLATNGQILADSGEGYTRTEARDQAIQSIMKGARGASVSDLEPQKLVPDAPPAAGAPTAPQEQTVVRHRS